MNISNKTRVNGTPDGPIRRQSKFSRAILVSLSLVIFAASISLFIMRSADHSSEEQNLAKEARTSPAPGSASGRSAEYAAPGALESPEAKPNDRSANGQHRLDKSARKPVPGISARERRFISRIRELARTARLKQLQREGKAETLPPSGQSLATVGAAADGVFRALPLPRAPLEKTPVFSILGKPEKSTKQASPESPFLSSAISNVQQGQSERAEHTVPAVVERVEAENLPQRKLPTETRRLASEQIGGSETSTTDNASGTTIADGKTTTGQAVGSAGAPASTNDATPVAARQEKAVPAAPRIFAAGDLRPKESRLVRARPFNGDVRDLPQTPPRKRERPEREKLQPTPRIFERSEGTPKEPTTQSGSANVTTPSAPAPPPIASFDGLDLANFGFGWPPDTVGDVGPTYYIQNINTSIGIYRKSDGVRVAGFSFDTFMSQGNFGNLCDSANFGDPVVLYDTFEDRWIITDFAFELDGNDVANPPGAFECFAVSQTGDPVAGGWNFYSINTTGGLGDYPKLGIWPDGLYMMVNMFDYAASGSYQNARVYAFNKAQMYAGDPTVQVVSFDVPSDDFTILPSNARLQTGTPPAGTPNYFVSTWQFLNALTVYKFHVDWERISTSTFTGPDIPLAASSWPNASVPNAPSLGGSPPGLDVLQIRAMMQNQYSNIGGVESLWTSHTVRRGDVNGFAAPRYYQVNVTGGTVAANITQAATWDPDGANVIHRFMPSVAVNRMGDMALGYSTSSSTTKPAIKYAGRLAGDPVNTLSLTEQLLIQGAGTQTNNISRWGDYSAMTLDPDGCTFWYTNEYYAVDGVNYLTRIGSFAFPSCTPVGSGGTVSGTVTATTGGAPISGATVAFGSRTTTTNGSGFYSFSSIPAGTYPSISASFPGFNPGTSTPVVVTDAMTTTKNFSLGTAPTSACLTDTSQSDFQTGVPASVDLTGSPGNVVLMQGTSIDQQNTTLGGFGVGITTTTWGGQTFTPAVTGTLQRADINLFCSACTGTTPDLTLSIRATSGGLPTGADITSATIPGFSSNFAVFYTANFAAPPVLSAGTQYALVIRPTANPSAGIYALTRSGEMNVGEDVYAGGTRVSGAASGTSWSIPNTGPSTTDTGFKTFVNSGFTSGTQISSLKDANPAPTFNPNWTTLSWNATLPANTTVQFQVAASNDDAGPFDFVGPDGTAATFFTTSGASLAQFNGNRYLKYKAYLSTTDNTVTPTLNDVTVCFNNTAPTDATLNWFTAETYPAGPNRSTGGVLLKWQTGYEVANLGFHIYREEAGKRVRVTPDFVAGSALFVDAGTVLGAGRSYVWRDPMGGNADSLYWLESIDLNGFSMWYGPVRAATSGDAKKEAVSAQVEPASRLISELAGGAGTTSPIEPRAVQIPMTIAGLASQAMVTGLPAVKISVQREGWYRISQSEMAAAGLDPNVDPQLLRLSVDGQEQPINVVIEKDGRLSAIEFYGIGIESPYTNLRSYWLTTGDQPGKRIGRSDAAGPDVTGGSFPYAVERRERTIYFSGLRNGDRENFFGPVIARDPVDQSLTLARVATDSTDSATLEVGLQGVTNTAHSVAVELNGTYKGTISFNSKSEGVGRFDLPASELREGQNALRLVSQGGPSDISLIDYVRLTYPHRYTAEGNVLRFTVPGNQMVTVDGFNSPDVRVLDVTNPGAVREIIGTVQQKGDGYAVSLNLQSVEPRTMLAIAGDLSKPIKLAANNPSSWRHPGNGANLVILTRRELFASLDPLVSLRQKQGYSIAVVDIEDIYDEFSYGQKTPRALKDFLTYAATNWKKAPRFVMLAGDASFDPKNYLGFGDSDLIPTKLIDTQYMETASDDWLVDFNDDGLPDISIGRLPVRSSDETFRLASKIAGYDRQQSARTLLLVSDHNDSFDFETASNILRGLVPRNIRVETVDRAHLDDATAKARLLDAINRGQIIVNYTGHGSAGQWRGNLLTSADAASLTNAGDLSMFVMMTCLNGFFQDAALDSLAESLLKANGGAVAAWGSSGMTTPDIQSILNQQVYRMIFDGKPITIGEATARAKAAVTDGDVRRTWILLGDPTTRLSR